MEDFITNLPKAELHLHIEGTLEPELFLSLAQRNRIQLQYSNVEQLRKAYQFTNLQSFLDIYYQGMSVLIHEQDFYDLTWAYLQKAHQQNVRHVEIFFDPQAHNKRNISYETVIQGIHHALTAAKQELGITSRLIPCILRDESVDSAMATLDNILVHADWVTAIGLDSAEVGNPPEKFQQVFEKARSHGLRTVAHAGEEGSPDYIWQAIKLLKVSRVDHGVRCLEDRQLVEYLAENQVPLTTCPLSNVKLKVYEQLSQHPIKQMLEKGLCATINSDDPAYFGGYLNENYIETQRTFSLTKQDLYTLAKNSFTASFLDSTSKAKYLQELKSCYENSPPPNGNHYATQKI